MGVGGAAGCLSLEAEMYHSKYIGECPSVHSREFGSVCSSKVQMN